MIDNTNVNPQGRLPWIDYAKTIGIWLVVLGHMRVLSGKPFIYMFHMAFFFMLSGYLYYRNLLRVELAKSFFSLLVPYLFFNAILLLIAFLVGDFQVSMIKNILLCNYELFPVRYFNPLWFLVSLFLMRVVCSLVPDRYYVWLCLFFLLLSTVLFYTHSLPLDKEPDYYQLATTCICIPSFLFGWLIKQYGLLSYLDKCPKVPRIIILTIVIFAMLLLGRMNGRVNVFTCAVGKDILLYYFVSTIISFVAIYLFSKLFVMEKRIVKEISLGTILILGLHVAMIDGFSYGIEMNSAYSILLSIIIMTICWILIKISLKFFPFILGKNKRIIIKP